MTRNPQLETIRWMDGVVPVSLMTANDLSEVITLFDEYRVFYGRSPNLDLAESFIRERFALQDSWLLVAKTSENIVVGFCQIYPSISSLSACRTGILNDLFVAPALRSHGVGSALLKAAHALALVLGLNRLELSTAHDNDSARRLYEAHGWIEDTHFTTYGLSITQSNSTF